MPSPMKTQHTPGSWKATKVEGMAHWNISAGQLCLANVPDFIGSAVTLDHDGEGPANAHLIAASPDLLSIAQRWLAWTQNGVQPIAVRIQLEADTRAAISKAMGGAQ